MNKGTNKDFLIIGLTGGSGSGKMLISQVFEEYGIMVINADQIARKVAERSTPCLEELREYFGDEIIDEDGNLKRRLLANIAFADKEKTRMLNQITHKYIRIENDRLMERYKAEGRRGVLMDAPVLIESGFYKKCHIVISVLSERETRAKRIVARDNIPFVDAYRRIDAQQNDEFYIKHSHYVIYNNGDIQDALAQAKQVIEAILSSE
jgi:dephospho-CoA kinase